MSAILFIFPLTVVVSLVIAARTGRFVSRKACFRKHWQTQALSFLAGLAVFAAGILCAVNLCSDKYKFGVLPCDVPIKLPEEAWDVDYRWSWSGSRYTADFGISETGFLNWMKEMGLSNRTDRFITPKNKGTYWAEVHAPPFPKYSGLGLHGKDGSTPPLCVQADDVRNHPEPSVVSVLITNGYYHDDYNTEGFDDSGRTIIYDSDAKRAYCRISIF